MKNGFVLPDYEHHLFCQGTLIRTKSEQVQTAASGFTLKIGKHLTYPACVPRVKRGFFLWAVVLLITAVAMREIIYRSAMTTRRDRMQRVAPALRSKERVASGTVHART